MLKRFKISQKLIAIITISTVFLILVGIVGLLSMNTMNNNVDTIYANNLVSLEKLYSAQSKINLGLSDMEHILNSNFKDSYQDAVDHLRDLSTENNKILSDYEKIPPSTTKEKADYKRVKQLLVQYRNVRIKIMDDVKQGNYEGANAIYNGQYVKIKEQLVNSIDSVIEDKVQSAENTSKLSNSVFKKSFIFLMVIIIVGAIIVDILGINAVV